MTFEHESPAVSDLAAATGVTVEEAAERVARALENITPVLTPREQAARRLLALRALETLLKDTAARIRREDGAAFTKAGQREVAELPDGTPLGNVRADPGKAAGWAVVDAGRFLAFVQATCPDAVRVKVVETAEVDPEYVDLILADLEAGKPVARQDTGEVLQGPPPGVEFRPAGAPVLKVTGDKAAPAAVARLLGPTFAQLGIES